MSDDRTPDALYVPHQSGNSPYVRASKVTDIARKVLKMPDGPAPVIEFAEQHDDKMVHFVRRTVQDTKLFPKNHERAGEPRYDWVEGPDGVRLGYLKGE